MALTVAPVRSRPSGPGPVHKRQSTVFDDAARLRAFKRSEVFVSLYDCSRQRYNRYDTIPRTSLALTRNRYKVHRREETENGRSSRKRRHDSPFHLQHCRCARSGVYLCTPISLYTECHGRIGVQQSLCRTARANASPVGRFEGFAADLAKYRFNPVWSGLADQRPAPSHNADRFAPSRSAPPAVRSRLSSRRVWTQLMQPAEHRVPIVCALCSAHAQYVDEIRNVTGLE